jgi:hypothetical protein
VGAGAVRSRHGTIPFQWFIDDLSDFKFVALDAAIGCVLSVRGIDANAMRLRCGRPHEAGLGGEGGHDGTRALTGGLGESVDVVDAGEGREQADLEPLV